MAEAVLSFFVQKLGEQLVQEVELLSGVRDDVVWIKDELQSMRAFLKDADQRREREVGVETWVTQVRHLVFNAEDAVDEFMIRMESQRRLQNRFMGCLVFHACFIKHLIVQHRFSTQIQKIRKDVKEIQERSVRYGFQAAYQEGRSSNATDAGHQDPGIAAWVEEADIVGLEKDVMKLGQLLLEGEETEEEETEEDQETAEEETQQHTVISIVGMGGLGKTTLAKKVYQNTKTSFDCHAWINVSQSFQIKDILKRMLKGLYESRKEMAPNAAESSSEIELASMIHGYLQGKRYALVLDDIWDIRVWEEVKHALPHEGRGKIIFTTRHQNVASSVDERCYLHKLEPLSRDLAWELFRRKAFRNKCPQDTCPQQLIPTAEALVRRCEGLPLAIVTIGGLMSKKNTLSSEWNDVLENLDWELSHNQSLSRLYQVLITSYHYLPPHLKFCFLYCALFPEDHIIKRNKLIRLWVAEGFIEEHPRKMLEEVASDYFIQLMDRNLIQPVIREATGELIACQVHDLMRDIAIHMFKKEEFAAILTNQKLNSEEAQRDVRTSGYLQLSKAKDAPRWDSAPRYHPRTIFR